MIEFWSGMVALLVASLLGLSVALLLGLALCLLEDRKGKR
jgi:hypothetical protein